MTLTGYYDKDGKFVKFLSQYRIVGVVRNGEVIGDFTEKQKEYLKKFGDGYIILERGQLKVVKQLDFSKKKQSLVL